MTVHSQQFIVDERGKKTAIVLPIKKYEKLMADLHDLAVVAERKNEESVGMEKMKICLMPSGRPGNKR